MKLGLFPILAFLLASSPLLAAAAQPDAPADPEATPAPAPARAPAHLVPDNAAPAGAIEAGP